MRFHEVSSTSNEVVYTGSYHVIKQLARIAFGLKTTGGENIPDDGAGLVAANHRSWADIFALPLAVEKRHISVLARDSLYENWFLKQLFTRWEAVPISRYEFSREDYRRVNERLAADRLVGLFPEMTRGDKKVKAIRLADKKHANLLELSGGVARFARNHNAPIIPAAISGLDYVFTNQHFQNRNGRVALGEPMEPPKNRQSEKVLMAELRSRIEQLYEQTLEM